MPPDADPDRIAERQAWIRLGLLAVAAAACIAAAAWWALAPAEDRARPLLDLLRRAPPPLPMATATQARPAWRVALWVPLRDPVPPPPPPETPPAMSLITTIVRGAARSALIDLGPAGMAEVALGGEVLGYRVDAIDAQRVTLTRHGRSRVLAMQGSEGGP